MPAASIKLTLGWYSPPPDGTGEWGEVEYLMPLKTRSQLWGATAVAPRCGIAPLWAGTTKWRFRRLVGRIVNDRPVGFEVVAGC